MNRVSGLVKATYICPLCKRKVDTLLEHQYSYYPEKTILVRPRCNHRSILMKEHPALCPSLDDAKRFYHAEGNKRAEKEMKIQPSDFLYLGPADMARAYDLINKKGAYAFYKEHKDADFLNKNRDLIFTKKEDTELLDLLKDVLEAKKDPTKRFAILNTDINAILRSLSKMNTHFPAKG